ncbi:MAG: hypothetical protein ABFR47_00145 [Verrucomicrobiota bacterium]
MKKVLSITMIMVLAAGIATNVAAKSEKKNAPKRRFVEETLAEIGEKHSPEKMDVKKITSVEIGDTYYHIYEGELDKTGYHIIVFDNYENYLGYYKSEYPPSNYQIDGCIVIDSNEIDDETGDQVYFRIPIDEKKGLPKKLELGGIPVSLVKSPYSEAKAQEKSNGGPAIKTTKGVAEEEKEEEVKPEFRTWTITKKGKKFKARAIFLKREGNNIFLRLEANSMEGSFSLFTLSKEDQEYVKQFKKKK